MTFKKLKDFILNFATILDTLLIYCLVVILGIEILPVLGVLKMLKLLTVTWILLSVPFNRVGFGRMLAIVLPSLIGVSESFGVTLLTDQEPSGSSTQEQNQEQAPAGEVAPMQQAPSTPEARIDGLPSGEEDEVPTPLRGYTVSETRRHPPNADSPGGITFGVDSPLRRAIRRRALRPTPSRPAAAAANVAEAPAANAAGDTGANQEVLDRIRRLAESELSIGSAKKRKK